MDIRGLGVPTRALCLLLCCSNIELPITNYRLSLMKIPSVIILFLLAGCGGQAIVQPVPVDMAVPVVCRVVPPPEPDWRVPRLSADAAMTEQLKAVLSDLTMSRSYIETLQAVLVACS